MHLLKVTDPSPPFLSSSSSSGITQFCLLLSNFWLHRTSISSRTSLLYTLLSRRQNIFHGLSWYKPFLQFWAKAVRGLASTARPAGDLRELLPPTSASYLPFLDTIHLYFTFLD